jgi:hypothetical protein
VAGLIVFNGLPENVVVFLQGWWPTVAMGVCRTQAALRRRRMERRTPRSGLVGSETLKITISHRRKNMKHLFYWLTPKKNMPGIIFVNINI